MSVQPPPPIPLTAAQRTAALDAVLALDAGDRLARALLERSLGASAAVYYRGLDRRGLWGVVLDLYGARLVAGGRAEAKNVRAALLRGLTEERVRGLARLGRDGFEVADGCGVGTAGYELALARLAARRWTDGGTWARAFVAATGLPEGFAGRRKFDSADAVRGLRPPPPLKPFQQRLSDSLLETLAGRTEHRRVILSLPTGGGKTRTAGDALMRLIVADHPAEGAYYLWLAQSEELCEQATLCLQQLWAHQLPGEPVAVHRYFGGRDIKAAALRSGAPAPHSFASGVVVASIQQLVARIARPGPIEDKLLRGLRAIVIDECHRATSASYTRLFTAVANVNRLGHRVPVGGLTATPGRARNETNDLIRAFGRELLLPQLDGDDGAHPLEAFRARGYLARPEHEVVTTGFHVRTPEPPSRAAYEWQAFTARVGKELGRAQIRNRLIVERLLAVPPGTPTLVYACSVEHVALLHALLRLCSRTSAFLTGTTPRPERHAIIEAFRAGEVDFLVNYGVLTTGFDAPKTGCVAITRPITSEVLYEQIVGRGLRGAAFGGTERCLILDFEDNFKHFGDQLAYHRFTRFWETARRVEGKVGVLEAGAFAKTAPRRRKRGKAPEGPRLF